jgi:hypothetical protein
MTAMTPEEFKNKMETIKEHWANHTSEILHCKADKMVANMLTELGYGEGAKIYSDLPKRYGWRRSLWEKPDCNSE